MSAELKIDWWSSLNHGGLLISSARIPSFFGGELAPFSRKRIDLLRKTILGLQEDKDEKSLNAFLDNLFELPPEQWRKGAEIDPKIYTHTAVTGEAVKPRRVWVGYQEEILPLFVEKDCERLGVGRGKRAISRVLEWLRAKGHKVALLTNAKQIRLIHAGPDYEAFCEWDTSLWFEEGEPGPQVEAFRRLLSKQSLSAPKKGDPPPLIDAILSSRRGQSELSAILGERVRQAVETLILNSSKSIADTKARSSINNGDLYVAATRIIMRLVVVLFAEARELLPRSNPIYFESYGLQGLREELDRAAAGKAERLRHRYSAWPRLLSLFRLIHEGSAHEELPILKYGGGLFEPGTSSSSDSIQQALVAFESSSNLLTDDVVYRIIELLTRSKVKVRQGKGSMLVESPVDFSDLSSEYIGILYEGLLDFELRQAPDTDAMVFLEVGDQPVLPLSRLKQMKDSELASLFEKLKTKKKDEDEEDSAEDEEAEEESEEDSGDEAVEDAAEDSTNLDDERRKVRSEVDAWGKRAVIAAKIVKAKFDEEAKTAGQRLTRRVIYPGEWFLVRWGGTRKGSGTFYTRPQLARPTTERTLQPLAYNATKEEKNEKTGLTEVLEWAPKKPEEILALKVCDPAMGSGSFLVSALRYLTEALLKSLFEHKRLEPKGDGTICRLADGKVTGHPKEETLPVPQDHPEFVERLRSRLKRHVVEACIYGVDLDPVAVELARLALWIETMDRSLPFEFLDHKLKNGNALVGCWFDRFQYYPLAAWEREGGDKGHNKFVHHYSEETKGKKSGDKWTKAISKIAKERIKPELGHQIRGQFVWTFEAQGATAAQVHESARRTIEKMSRISLHEVQQRAEMYTIGFRGNEAVQQLRQQLDTWCAVWFWPGDSLDVAPSPLNYHKLPEKTAKIVEQVAKENRFFHWELEFPDVFATECSGFDAVLGNPPWNTQKPLSKEFFSNYDPLYRTYGKEEAIVIQKELFEKDTSIEKEWISYQYRFKGLSNWVNNAGNPFGDPKKIKGKKGLNLGSKDDNLLHDTWRKLRKNKGYADPEHPFIYQGSADLNSYKLFLEVAHALLKKEGQLGFVVPSGLYTDKGTTELRELFLDKCRWQWLFGFENREKIFDIDSRFKFAPVIVQKGGQTEALRASFMHRRLEDWETADEYIVKYPLNTIRSLSPRDLSIVESNEIRFLDLIEGIYSRTVRLSVFMENGLIDYGREFHMTDDAKLFPSLDKWVAKGFSISEPGGICWKGKSEEIIFPFYEGRMIRAFDFCAQKWVSGKSRKALWVDIPFDKKTFGPQYLMSEDVFLNSGKTKIGSKLGIVKVSSATNTRSMKCSYIPYLPCGESVYTLQLKQNSVSSLLYIASCLSSLCFDSLLRFRFGGLNISAWLLGECSIPKQERWVDKIGKEISKIAGTLSFTSLVFSRDALLLKSELPNFDTHPPYYRSAITKNERLRLRVILDALFAHTYGLSEHEFRILLNNCDFSLGALRDSKIVSKFEPKGFWRVDDDLKPELRHTVLSLVAFSDLQRVGLDTFLTQNNGEGWMLPEKLRLADYGLGHDDRAKEYQPVASVLGPRFYPWQLEQSVQESWEECEAHAELLDKILPLPKTEATSGTPKAEAGKTDLFGKPLETDLFGEVVPPKGKKK